MKYGYGAGMHLKPACARARTELSALMEPMSGTLPTRERGEHQNGSLYHAGRPRNPRYTMVLHQGDNTRAHREEPREHTTRRAATGGARSRSRFTSVLARIEKTTSRKTKTPSVTESTDEQAPTTTLTQSAYDTKPELPLHPPG